MTAADFGISASNPYDGNWDFIADTSTGGSTADDDGYYWKMVDRPILYFFDGTNHVQIGDDGGYMF